MSKDNLRLEKRSIRMGIGDVIPSVSLPSTLGIEVDPFRSSQDQNVVLFFFPGDGEGLRYPELAGCTQEACSFRNQLRVFLELNTVVFGISLQSAERQMQFVEREHLNFALLSDSDKKLVDALGIPLWISGEGEEYVSRATFIVQKGGRIQHIYHPVDVNGHIENVLARIRESGINI